MKASEAAESKEPRGDWCGRCGEFNVPSDATAPPPEPLLPWPLPLLALVRRCSRLGRPEDAISVPRSSAPSSISSEPMPRMLLLPLEERVEPERTRPRPLKEDLRRGWASASDCAVVEEWPKLLSCASWRLREGEHLRSSDETGEPIGVLMLSVPLVGRAAMGGMWNRKKKKRGREGRRRRGEKR